MEGNANFSESYVFSTGELYAESVSSSCALTAGGRGEGVSCAFVTKDRARWKEKEETHGNA